MVQNHQQAKKVLLTFIVLIASGCSSMTGSDAMQFRNIAKSNVGLVAEMHYQQVDALLQQLTRKLYQRNPDQLRKSGKFNLQQRVDQLFGAGVSLGNNGSGIEKELDAMYLAMNPEYSGDRVFMLMLGLKGMLDKSYNNRSEFYLLNDSLDENKLYRSARNIEVLMWMLARRSNAEGRLLLFTNSLPGESPVNLSFERLFGKLIATQDMMARITAQKNQRLLNTVVHNVASMVFLPF